MMNLFDNRPQLPLMLAQKLLLVVALLAGCESAHVAQPLTGQMSGTDADSQMAFWHTLAERPVTSNDEALHGLLLFIEAKEAIQTYEQRVEELRKRQILPRGFDRPATEAVQRGTLAVAIARFLELEGGLSMRIFGPTPRYATRELQYMNLYPPSSPHQTFSGAKFVGIIGRIEDYQRVTHPMGSASIRDKQAPQTKIQP